MGMNAYNVGKQRKAMVLVGKLLIDPTSAVTVLDTKFWVVKMAEFVPLGP